MSAKARARYITLARWWSFVAMPIGLVMVAWNADKWWTWVLSIPIWIGAYWMTLFFIFQYGRLQMQNEIFDEQRKIQQEILDEQLERDQIRWNAQHVALQDLAVLMVKYGISPDELRPIVERGFAP